jgi:hypothetical protein
MTARWNDLPLRLRLTFLYVGLLLLLLVALGAFLYFSTRDFVISATASRLQALANTSITHLAPRAIRSHQTFRPSRSSGVTSRAI